MVNPPLHTIASIFAATVERVPAEPALGAISEGTVAWQTWLQLYEAARRRAADLISAGIEAGDRVAQIGGNSLDWITSDLAIHLVRGVHVPIHESLSTEQIAHQIKDCGAKIVLPAERANQFQVRGLPAQINGKPRDLTAVDQRTSASSPDDLATILYTSGTTGEPRGVMLTQRNLTHNAVTTTLTVGGDSRDLRLCFLPLSHIYARTCDLYSWLFLGSRLVLAESRETIVRDCQLVQPTALNGVPYFYQKVHDRVRSAGAADEPAALRQALGGKVDNLYCGGAALAPEVEEWFERCGLPILPGYGLTETSPVVSVSTRTIRRSGSVGRAIDDVDVRIADGEVLVRGPNIMQGYWNNPAGTASAVRDGWFHTGDLGHLDDDGYLFIRGRRKEIIVLSTGKNVSPTRVEGLLAASPLIEQVAVVGDGRSCLGAIIVPSADALRAEIRRRRIFVWSRRRALRHRRVREIYAQEVARRLQSGAREEQVHAFTLIDRGFSLERGEVTPKLSLRRAVVEKNFRAEIEAMYADRVTAGPI